MSLNTSEKEYLNKVNSALVEKRGEGISSLTLAELGNMCSLTKSQKGKCRKLSVLVKLDDRFRLLEDGSVELAGGGASELARETLPHVKFFQYMCNLSEDELILCEDIHHLEHHFRRWAEKTQTPIQGNISQHVSMIIDDLTVDNKVTIHHDSCRIIFETHDGKIASRVRAIENMMPLPCPPPSSPPAQGISILTGTDWSNCYFNDQTEFEKGMFKDNGQLHEYEVRSESFLYDKKKRYTGPAVFRCVLSEAIEVEGCARYDHIATMGRVKYRVECLKRLKEKPEILVMSYFYPGSPPLHNLAIAVAPPSINIISPEDTPDVVAYKTLWRDFKMSIPLNDADRLALFANCDKGSGWRWPSDITWDKPEVKGTFPRNDYKNLRYKLIPNVVDGNWVVRNAMPAAVPCLLGQKVQQRYFRTPDYVEIDVDVGSSAIATNVIGVLRGYARHVKVQYGFIIQGECEEELPERVFVAQSVDYADYTHLKKIGDIPRVEDSIEPMP